MDQTATLDRTIARKVAARPIGTVSIHLTINGTPSFSKAGAAIELVMM